MSDQESRFREEAAAGRRGLLSEMLSFVMENKKGWLLPILITILSVGVLVALGGSGAAPFIYTLF
jgi:hypothetical protein